MGKTRRIWVAGAAIAVILGAGCGSGSTGTTMTPPEAIASNGSGPGTQPGANQGATGARNSSEAPGPTASKDAPGGNNNAMGAQPPKPGPQGGATSPQSQPRGTSGFGRGGNMAFILNNEQIRKELGITGEQAKKIEAAMPQRAAGGGNAAPPVGEPSQADREKQREELQAKIDAILTPAQKTRIQQIQLQMAGARALTSPEIAKDLGLSSEQTKKIEEIVPQRVPGGPQAGGGQGGRQNAPGGGGFSSPGAQGGGGQRMTPEERQKQREDQLKKVNEVLTPEQRAKWEAMKGKPFEMKFQPRGNTGQGGGGRQGNRDSGF